METTDTSHNTAKWAQHNKISLCVVPISLCCALLGHCKFPFQMQNLLKGEYLKESRNMIYEGLR